MIVLHFHLQPQYRYELFHINFTSLHCTGRYELNKLTSLPMCGFIAQLVEHRTSIAEVTGSNPVEALVFFRLLLSNCLNWKIYCDDHPSLSDFIMWESILNHVVPECQSQQMDKCKHWSISRKKYSSKWMCMVVFSKESDTSLWWRSGTSLWQSQPKLSS